MQNINQKLDEIIFRYDIDCFYPKYRMMRQAEQYLASWGRRCMEAMSEGEKILCIALNNNDMTRFRFYTSKVTCFDFCVYEEKNWQELIEKAKDYADIYVVSFDREKRIDNFFTQNKIVFQNIYDVFSQNGMIFDNTFYHFLERPQEVVEELGSGAEWDYADNNFFLENYYLKKYDWEKNRSGTNYIVFLQKMIFLSLAFKDFILWERYQTKLVEELTGERKKDYLQAEAEIKSLLEEIRTVLQTRDQKDIVMIWLDAMKYRSEKTMPFLEKEMHSGMFFENAYTVLPNTSPTFRTCFTDEKDFSIRLQSNDHITKENSSLYEAMKKRKYDFCVISGYLRGSIDGEWLYGECLDLWAPASVIFWNLLCCLAESQKPVFLVAHEVGQTHAPFWTNNIGNSLELWSNEQIKTRRRNACEEVNEQLSFYMSFLGEKIIKIYMSDHGVDEPWEQIHTLFAVKAKTLGSGVVSGMFSYRDFDKLAIQLMDDRWEPTEFVSPYVQVGTLPLYNSSLIKERIGDKSIRMADLGYVGIVDKHFFYLRYHNGRELLLDRNRMPFGVYVLPCANEICDNRLLEKYRELSQGMKIDLQDKKFRYSRCLFEIAERMMRFSPKKVDSVNRWIEGSGKQRIAVRMGGNHSKVLYDWLSADNQKKIVCFIDADKNCLCSGLGKKIISLDEMEDEGIDGVILSSYAYLDELRCEAQKYSKDIFVLDLYEYLTKAGYPHREYIYDPVGMPYEEYEVEFPGDD